MTTTYNPNQSISLESPCRELIINFERAEKGMVTIETIDDASYSCFADNYASECYYTNDAKSLFYSYISSGYSIV